MSVDAIEHAEHTADRVRQELLQTLQELDRRRETALDLRYQAWRNRQLLAGIAGSMAAMIAAKALISYGVRKRQQRKLVEERRQGLLRAWYHPERLAAVPRRKSRPVALTQKLLSLTGAAVTSLLLRQVLRRAIG